MKVFKYKYFQLLNVKNEYVTKIILNSFKSKCNTYIEL